MSQNELVSNSYSQKKYLGWNDLDVKANREWMRKDSAMRWELAQIEAAGPDWEKQAEQAADAAAAAPPAAGGMGAAPMGGAPPAFGPEPAGEAPLPGPDAAAPTDAPVPPAGPDAPAA